MEEEIIKCPKCDGTGKYKLIRSTIKSLRCELCKFQALGSTQVEDFQKHRGLCRECRKQPLGYDRELKKDEVCPDCGKKWREH